jgi:septal ring factor EnvC (AmiA/AmiB activator)
MQNKIFVFLIAGILFISMFAFALAQNETGNATPNLISAREQVKEKINETRNEINLIKEEINATREHIKEIRQNITEIRQNWTDYKAQVMQQVKDQRITYVSCVSDSAKVKNECLIAVNQKTLACSIAAINNSDKNATKQCLSEYKDARTECMSGFKNTKTECAKAKHNFFDSLRVMFK